MKKRLLAAVMTGMLAIAAILATPIVTSAKTYTAPNTWQVVTPAGPIDSGIPVIVSTSTGNPNNVNYVLASVSSLTDSMLAIASPYQLEDPDYIATANSFRDYYVVNVVVSFEYFFSVGEVITIPHPVLGSGELVSIWYPDYWSVNPGTNTVNVTCLDRASYFELSLLYHPMTVPAPGGTPASAPVAPAPAPAASGAEATGEVIKASGDYALSYDALKFLEDHPGVTLEYTLTYEGNEYLIVIPGGLKFADPSIPWYSPQFLIQYFAK